MPNAKLSGGEAVRRNEVKRTYIGRNGMEWISVDDRLPKIDRMYLVFFQGAVTVLPFISNRWHWGDNSFMYDEKSKFITHWMPLPAPPK